LTPVTTRRSVSLLVVMAALLSAACATTAGSAGDGIDTIAATTAKLPPHEPRPGRDRPVVAVIAHHRGAEITDFVIPYGVLAASGAAEVVAVGTRAGPVAMFPALTLEPEMTTAEFDERYPDGADYLIVPAVHHPGAPELTDWVRLQAARGGTVVGVCDGVVVLARAGLLDGRRATAHWHAIGRLERRHPGTTWVRNQRYVADGKVITTSGVSASVPVSMALVEAIAGGDRARRLAADLGVDAWGPEHDSGSYRLRRHIGTAAGNLVRFWSRDHIGIPVEYGVDELTLALTADLWARTYRSAVVTVASSWDTIVTRSGLRIIPDRVQGDRRYARIVEVTGAHLTGSAIDRALAEIAEAYGAATAAFVATQVEYPWP
jgi:transcriptional regulator GlxA family with amidase domain